MPGCGERLCRPWPVTARVASRPACGSPLQVCGGGCPRLPRRLGSAWWAAAPPASTRLSTSSRYRDGVWPRGGLAPAHEGAVPALPGSQRVLGWFSGLLVLFQPGRWCWGAAWGSPDPTSLPEPLWLGQVPLPSPLPWAVHSGLRLVAVSSSQVIFLESNNQQESASLKAVVIQQE